MVQTANAKKNQRGLPNEAKLREIGRRCPGCGHLVEMPCRICAGRSLNANRRTVRDVATAVLEQTRRERRPPK